MVRIGAPRRENEAGRSEPLGDARQRSEVPRVLDVIEVEPYLPGTRRDAGEVCPRQGADGEQTARRIGVRQGFENPAGREQRRTGETGKHFFSARGGEKLRGRHYQLQLGAASESLENQVWALEDRFRASRPPYPADCFDSLVARTLDHGARS